MNRRKIRLKVQINLNTKKFQFMIQEVHRGTDNGINIHLGTKWFRTAGECKQILNNAADPSGSVNDLGEIRIRTAKPLFFDGYATNRLTGSFILIEPGTNATVGAGLLLPPAELYRPEPTDYAI